MEKSHAKVSEYIWNRVYNQELKIGDKIPSERDLAKMLNISRNSVREGLRVLDNIGIISSYHGSGNYISAKFEKTISEIMSFMYLLNGMNEKEITEFRYALEWQAVNIIAGHLTDDIKEKLTFHLEKLENSKDEEEATIHDKAIHYLIIEATDNNYMKYNYSALNEVMNFYIPCMRGKIIFGMKSEDELRYVHRAIVEGLIQGDVTKALNALQVHFKYIIRYQKK